MSFDMPRFLNFDDEDTIEEDNGIPNAEEVGILDNSGWSSRTTGVAKYLQTLFDTESGHGRKVLSMDNLLSGKTRMEASRMFFETLAAFVPMSDPSLIEQYEYANEHDIKCRIIMTETAPGDKMVLMARQPDEILYHFYQVPINRKGFVGKVLGQLDGLIMQSVKIGETGIREITMYLLDYDHSIY
ncbi:hypothetical protein IFM89_004218 [Coptis chinensis]|uniref:Rad21/Rec8-like protein C-terminal eukaryotic domain-containing protein n=1 Tax=Coptis chinensis TaxID=261450 RepID=A0A835IBG8_9MAGN|nr:hypothetical protein IFM89_004218 [Coptis chinensis]